MNVLLTGGAGYIGSHTAFALRQTGFTPIVLDDLSQGRKSAVKYGPFVLGDVGDAAGVRALCATYRPVALIHFAAFIEVGESVAHPGLYMDNNFNKSVRLFDAARACGVDKVVFSSTAAVYGAPESSAPIRETHPLKPINPYGESKLKAETYLRAVEGLRSVTLRYFNAAGAAPLAEAIGEAHEPETHLIPNAVLAGLGLKPAIKLFGTDYPTPDGTAVRDYVHVMDLAAAHVAALRYLLADGATDVCNLGTGRGVSVREVIDAAEKTLGRPVPVVEEPRRAGDPSHLVADVSRAKERLDWQPQVMLSQIVESAAAWHGSAMYSQRQIK